MQRIFKSQEYQGSRSAGRLLFFFVVVAMLVCAKNTFAEENRFFRTVTLEQGLHQGSVNCFGCNVVLKGDLDGEIVTIGGDVTVFGAVRRDIVTVGGAIHLRNGAEVDASVVAIGGRVTTEGNVAGPGKFVSYAWMHLPGQLSIGWRGAVALVGFHAVCILLPVLLLRPWRVRNIASASRRWLITGLVGIGAIVAISFLMDLIDEELNAGDTAALVISTLFLAVVAAGIAGIALAIGERFFRGRLAVALLAGGLLLVVLELVPYLGFLVLVLGSCWATGAAFWSALGFRGPQSPPPRKVRATLKLT
jgi:hypothetical protein